MKLAIYAVVGFITLVGISETVFDELAWARSLTSYPRVLRGTFIRQGAYAVPPSPDANYVLDELGLPILEESDSSGSSFILAE